MSTGVYKKTKEHIRKIREHHNPISDKNLIRWWETDKAEEIKKKMSLAKKDYIPWNKDRKTGPLSETHKRSIGKGNKGKPSSRKGCKLLEKTKKKISEGLKRYFKKLKKENPELYNKRMAQVLKNLGSCARPTGVEQYYIDLFERTKSGFKYVGDGSYFIGGRNPDFIHKIRKLCLEVRPKIICKFWSNCTPKEYIKKKIKHYKKHNWDCLVLWWEEKPEKV